MHDATTNGTPAMILVPDQPPAGVSVEFVNYLREWCEAHPDRIRRCVIARFEGQPTVFVIPMKLGYDPALMDLAVSVDMDLHRKGWSSLVFPLLGKSTDDYPEFFQEDKAITVYQGNQGSLQHAECRRASEAG